VTVLTDTSSVLSLRYLTNSREHWLFCWKLSWLAGGSDTRTDTALTGAQLVKI